MANINMEVVSTPPSYVMGKEEKHHTRKHASPRRAGMGTGTIGAGRAKGTRHLCEWSVKIRLIALRGCGFLLQIFIFGDLGSKSARYGNLKPKLNWFRSPT
jgi:hypothetical protein